MPITSNIPQLQPDLLRAAAQGALVLAHLSHTDLDGYGCQYLSLPLRTHCHAGFYENTDYGPQIASQCERLLNRVMRKAPGDAPVLLLITDVNLTMPVCRAIERLAAEVQRHRPLQLVLLDHHMSGSKEAEAFPWYHLDVSASAAMLTWRFLRKNFGEHLAEYAEASPLEFTAGVIDAVDMWREGEPLFAEGNLLAGLFGAADGYLPMSMPALRRAHRFAMIKWGISHFAAGLAPRCLEHEVSHQLEWLLRQEQKRPGTFGTSYEGLADVDDLDLGQAVKLDELALDDPGVTLAQLHYDLVYNHLQLLRVPVVEVDGLRGAVVFEFPYATFQNVSNSMLKTGRYDYVAHVRRNRRMSMRSSGDVDVSALMRTYFGGGGHKNAAGGRLPGDGAFPDGAAAIEAFQRCCENKARAKK